MTTGYDCSAAAALSCFHVFALQSKGAFDVRWCTGSIGQRIFQPWIQQMTARGNVQIQSGKRVTDLRVKGSAYQVVVQGNNNEVYECDAVVMAVGGTALKKLAVTCPVLQQHVPESRYWKDSLRGVTCVAVRLFFDRSTPKSWLGSMEDSPVVVCGPNILPELVETGYCIYDLNRLQPTVFSNVTALEVDFFRADAIADVEKDDDVAVLTLRAVAAALQIPPIAQGPLLEVHVTRARNAVSHFCLHSAKASPGIRATQGLYFCGDWIDRTGHSSWSTEKAVVTGRQAALAISKDFGLQGCDTDVLPAAPDTPALAALRNLARIRRNRVAPF